MAEPAGLLATTSGSCGLRGLRASCTERGLPFSISDGWRTLDMRLALDAAVEAAQASDAVDDLLQWPAAAGQWVGEPRQLGERWLQSLTLVRGSFLLKQTALSLADHNGVDGTLSVEEFRGIRQRAGSSSIPLIALRNLFCCSVEDDEDDPLTIQKRQTERTSTRELLVLLIEALRAVEEKRQRAAEAHAQVGSARPDLGPTGDPASYVFSLEPDQRHRSTSRSSFAGSSPVHLLFISDPAHLCAASFSPSHAYPRPAARGTPPVAEAHGRAEAPGGGAPAVAHGREEGTRLRI